MDKSTLESVVERAKQQAIESERERLQEETRLNASAFAGLEVLFWEYPELIEYATITEAHKHGRQADVCWSAVIAAPGLAEIVMHFKPGYEPASEYYVRRYTTRHKAPSWIDTGYDTEIQEYIVMGGLAEAIILANEPINAESKAKVEAIIRETEARMLADSMHSNSELLSALNEIHDQLKEDDPGVAMTQAEAPESFGNPLAWFWDSEMGTGDLIGRATVFAIFFVVVVFTIRFILVGIANFIFPGWLQ